MLIILPLKCIGESKLLIWITDKDVGHWHGGVQGQYPLLQHGILTGTADREFRIILLGADRCDHRKESKDKPEIKTGKMVHAQGITHNS